MSQRHWKKWRIKGGLKMEELKSRTLEVLNNINQDWVKALKTAEEKTEGIDVTDLMGKFSANIVQLDKYFREAETRMKKQGKKGFF